jgi:hypothetical protein
MRRVAARETVEFDFYRSVKTLAIVNDLTTILDFETKAGR